MTRKNGGTTVATSGYHYDSAGRLDSLSHGSFGGYGFAYDAAGRRTSVTDALGQADRSVDGDDVYSGGIDLLDQPRGARPRLAREACPEQRVDDQPRRAEIFFLLLGLCVDD